MSSQIAQTIGHMPEQYAKGGKSTARILEQAGLPAARDRVRVDDVEERVQARALSGRSVAAPGARPALCRRLEHRMRGRFTIGVRRFGEKTVLTPTTARVPAPNLAARVSMHFIWRYAGPLALIICRCISAACLGAASSLVCFLQKIQGETCDALAFSFDSWLVSFRAPRWVSRSNGRISRFAADERREAGRSPANGMAVSAPALCQRGRGADPEGRRQCRRCGGRDRLCDGGDLSLRRWQGHRRRRPRHHSSCQRQGYFHQFPRKAPLAASANMYLDAMGNIIADGEPLRLQTRSLCRAR